MCVLLGYYRRLSGVFFVPGFHERSRHVSYPQLCSLSTVVEESQGRFNVKKGFCFRTVGNRPVNDTH
jgi:hypothetical protein